MILAGNTYVPDHDSYFTSYFKGSDVFEQKNLDLALSYVRHFNVAVDGGAHVGSWTRYMADRFEIVAAFEPNPDNFDCLVLNTTRCNNVILSKLGLSDRKQSGSLSQGNNTGCWHVTEGDDIKLMPLPDYGALDFVKLDIEGFEFNALNGMLALLKKYRPIVLIEEKDLPHKKLDYDARNLLLSIGYEQLDAIGRDVIFGSKNG